MMEVMVTVGAMSCKAPVKSSPPTNQHPAFLQAGCPSCHPTNSVKALKGKISHSMDLLTPSSPGGLPTLSLTTNSSWLPWGRVATPLISPLMPVPSITGYYVYILQ